MIETITNQSDYAAPMYECHKCVNFDGPRACAPHAHCYAQNLIVQAESPSCERFRLLKEHIPKPQ